MCSPTLPWMLVGHRVKFNNIVCLHFNAKFEKKFQSFSDISLPWEHELKIWPCMFCVCLPRLLCPTCSRHVFDIYFFHIPFRRCCFPIFLTCCSCWCSCCSFVFWHPLCLLFFCLQHFISLVSVSSGLHFFYKCGVCFNFESYCRSAAFRRLPYTAKACYCTGDRMIEIISIIWIWNLFNR